MCLLFNNFVGMVERFIEAPASAKAGWPSESSNGGGRVSRFSNSSGWSSRSSSLRLAGVAARSIMVGAGWFWLGIGSSSETDVPGRPVLLGKLGTRVFGLTLRLRSLSLACGARSESWLCGSWMLWELECRGSDGGGGGGGDVCDVGWKPGPGKRCWYGLGG